MFQAAATLQTYVQVQCWVLEVGGLPWGPGLLEQRLLPCAALFPCMPAGKFSFLHKVGTAEKGT